MTAAETARHALCDAMDVLEHLTTDEFACGGDRPARELIVEAIVTLGGDPATWPEYPAATARGTDYAMRA